nr:hypothetical protein [uncultured Acetatifactor sp.]
MKKRTLKFFLYILSLSCLLPAGCTPEEKTMILPMTSDVGTEAESSEAGKDFTVQKIYTYAYETLHSLNKSAFLQGCAENEIRILARDEANDDTSLVSRQVDYRYGFYDTPGRFSPFWEELLNPSGEMREELYVEKLLPSPDGRLLLVYVRSDFWNHTFVWLYSMEDGEYLLLYEGPADADTELHGSFSQGSRWVTFDIMGTTNEAEHFIPVYDCEKERSGQEEQALQLWKEKEPAFFCPPDQKLYFTPIKDRLLSASLIDCQDSAGLLRFVEEEKGLMAVNLEYPGPGVTAWKDSSVEMQEFLETNENASLYVHNWSYLYDYTGTRPLQYYYDFESSSLYYLGSASRLCRTDIFNGDNPENTADLLDFPGMVVDFLPLDSGEFLIVLAQDQGLEKYEMDPDNGNYINSQHSTGSFSDIQNYRPYNLSADLYLYQEDGTEGKLLYKNLRNLVTMEYDSSTRRILLETYEDASLTHRKCIILEL